MVAGCKMQAQTAVKVPAKRVENFPSGIDPGQITMGTKVLAFVKGPTKKTLYTLGSYVHIKSAGKGKIKGYISRIGDTAVMIDGIAYPYRDIEAYYVPMRLCTIFGSALCIAGGGYILLDGINGAINNKKPALHVEALAAGIPMAAAGGILLAFGKVKRSTEKWRIRIMEW